MSQKFKTRSVGRPRDIEKAVAILDAGWALFLGRGIEATSIEAIAAKAKVSKVTLYSHFPDKTALFEAAVLREMERIEQAQQVQGGRAEAALIDEQLRRFGVGILSFLTGNPATDFYSVIAGELRRHEKLARAFYDLGPGRTRANLAAILEAGMRRGELISSNPDHAAEHLFGMWQGFMHYQLALDIDADAIRADLKDRVERGVAAFMKLHGCPPSERLPESTALNRPS